MVRSSAETKVLFDKMKKLSVEKLSVEFHKY